MKRKSANISGPAMPKNDEFDVIVVGAGHAGCEAALASAHLDCSVLIVTFDLQKIAAMSCNPAIGGLGKGHMVKEIDALGGAMGLAADSSGIQFRLLNRSKGPAVRATRCQSDMRRYSGFMAGLLLENPSVEAVEGEVVGLAPNDGGFSVDVVAKRYRAPVDGQPEKCRYRATAVVVTTGTFLGGLMHTGLSSRPGGRLGDPASGSLSNGLRALGLSLGRLKTGTCPRLDGSTIDFDSLPRQDGDEPPPMFSFLSERPRLPQRPCRLTATNPATHAIIRKGLDRSPLYCGVIKGRGPRYCPSIEDKVVRFPDRERHQIFLEPEGLDTNEFYPNGISTSLPEDVQLEMVRSIKGLEQAEVLKFGYAVEYDFVFPTQLRPSLMTKSIPGLFLAGQLNGTSGYEEAAGQGLVAGINAARYCKGRPPFVLRRDQAYIGVMIDDLVTAGTAEPYRMFTSRAEHRMFLREDNADARLTPLGRDLGLVSDERWRAFLEKRDRMDAALARLKAHRVRHDGGTVAAIEILKRPGVRYRDVAGPSDPQAVLDGAKSAAVENAVEILVKFEGYIARERERLSRIAGLDDQPIPEKIDYKNVAGLSAEAAEKLSAARPTTLGHARRIPGITPAALSMLLIHLAAKGAVSRET